MKIVVAVKVVPDDQDIFVSGRSFPGLFKG